MRCKICDVDEIGVGSIFNPLVEQIAQGFISVQMDPETGDYICSDCQEAIHEMTKEVYQYIDEEGGLGASATQEAHSDPHTLSKV